MYGKIWQNNCAKIYRDGWKLKYNSTAAASSVGMFPCLGDQRVQMVCEKHNAF